MKKLSRLTALLLTLTMLVTSMPLMALANTITVDIDTWNAWVEDAQNAAANQTETVTSSVTVTGETSVVDRPVVEAALTAHEGVQTSATQAVTLPIAGKLVLKAYDKASSYQWQVKAGSQWANIVGDRSASTTLTYAKIQNAISGGVAQVRCVMVVDGQDYVSATAQVTVDDTVTYTTVETESTLTVTSEVPVRSNYALRSSSTTADVNTASTYTASNVFNVTIYYVFKNYKEAAPSAVYQMIEGTPFSAIEVQSPEVTGYTADKESVTLVYDGINKPDDIYVTYSPAVVNYTVKHYLQNLYDDGYTLKATYTKSGMTEDTVEIEPNEYTGYTNLLYETPTIAADGSTVVEIYYDRNYYLMNFDLDGGYGVEPIYARFETPISNVGTPKKTGYTFVEWTLNGANEKIAEYMPAENITYKATWQEADSSFTLVYWLENADDDKYSVFGSQTMAAKTGEKIDGENYSNYNDYIDTDSNFKTVEPFVTYATADKDVVVAGDKSSVVNVYYTRQEFTLKFYYAMEDYTNSANRKYYVIGGSTYYYGAWGTNTTNSLDNLTNYYMDGGAKVDHRGQVDEIPGLNSIGKNRNYNNGNDSVTKTVGSGRNQTTYKYNYYYISFTAKYGADISELWPCNVFNSVTRVGKDNANGWTGTEAFFSAWNGEHHVLYSQLHKGGNTMDENQTIKGNYNQLDTQLLWDKSQFDAYADSNNTVDFLCFWENGANGLNWNVPELYRYNIYVPVMEGQDTTGLTIREADGVQYYLRNTYDTVDDSHINSQTQPEITGFTKLLIPVDESYEYIVDDQTYSAIYEWEKIEGFDKNLYSEAYDVYFYYIRNQYNLSFQNDGITAKSESVYYEEDLKDKYFVPSYPSSTLEEGGYEFEGWYTTSTYVPGTKFEFDGETMPANDLMLYAHWVPKVYDVHFYQSEADIAETQAVEVYSKVPHGATLSSLFSEDALPDIDKFKFDQYENYDFAGWFYRDSNGVEKAFSLEATPIKSDMNIYAKWSSNVLVDYTIQFLYLDSEGNAVPVADPITGSGLATYSKTFEAKYGPELYDEYSEGYFPTLASQNLVLSIPVTGEADPNVLTFYYVSATVPYTVKYLDQETGEELLQEKTVDDNRKSYVVETFVPISGYVPDAVQKSLRLYVTEDEEFVIIFYYYKNEGMATYTLNYYKENAAGEFELKLSTSDVGYTEESGQTPAMISAAPYGYSAAHYTYDPNLTTYQVGSGQVTKYEAPLELTQDGLVINHYYIEDTTTINYVAVGPDGEMLSANNEIGNVDPAYETLKVMTGAASGSTATAHSNVYKFVGWYKDEGCTQPVDASWVDANNKITPQKEDNDSNTATPDVFVAATYYAKFEYNLTTLTITKEIDGAVEPNACFVFNVTGVDLDMNVVVKGQGSVTIDGLTVGTAYNVQEISCNWRYTLDTTVSTIELLPSGNEVKITNKRETDQWLDDNCYSENIFSAVTDPVDD